ncbi:MAG: hypothetical protein ACYTG5_06150 [Planctomycetota bacterium]|jgi:hypothetical protein
MKASEIINAACLSAILSFGSSMAATPQGMDSGENMDMAPPSAEMHLLTDGAGGYSGEVSYGGQEFLAGFFISGHDSWSVMNAAGDRFMNYAFPMAIGGSEDSVYRTELPLDQMLMIREEWYIQAVLLTQSGEFWFGPIEYLPDLLAAQQQQHSNSGPAADIRYELAVTEGIPATYDFSAEYEANSDDYGLEIVRIEKLGDQTDIYLVLITPGVGGGMLDIVETHDVYANLGEDPGSKVRVYVATRTQDEDEEDLDYSLGEELDT